MWKRSSKRKNKKVSVTNIFESSSEVSSDTISDIEEPVLNQSSGPATLAKGESAEAKLHREKQEEQKKRRAFK